MAKDVKVINFLIGLHKKFAFPLETADNVWGRAGKVSEDKVVPDFKKIIYLKSSEVEGTEDRKVRRV